MTLKEIANLAGVSVAAVSYAINGTGSVSEAMREKILKIVEETGYRSNSAARTLRTSTSHIIGVMVEDLTAWSSASVIQGIGQYAEENGKTMLISDLALYMRTGKELERLSEYRGKILRQFNTLLSSQVDGVIYVSLRDRDVTSLIPETEKPLVLVDCFSGDIPEITYDNYNISFEIGQRFVRNGHRSIAVLCGAPDYKSCYQRLSGFQTALRESGIPSSSVKLAMCSWEYEDALREMKALFSSPDHPTAIFAMNDQMGVAALRTLQQLGFRVPEEVEVVGFDNNRIAMYSLPSLTSVQVPLVEIGKRAASTLYRLRGKENVERRITLESSICERESTR